MLGMKYIISVCFHAISVRWRLSPLHQAAGSAFNVWEFCPVPCWRAHWCFSDLSQPHAATDQGKLAPLALLCIDILPGAGSSFSFGVKQHLCNVPLPGNSQCLGWEAESLGWEADSLGWEAESGLGSRVWIRQQSLGWEAESLG